jgi:hypothetical protein
VVWYQRVYRKVGRRKGEGGGVGGEAGRDRDRRHVFIHTSVMLLRVYNQQ